MAHVEESGDNSRKANVDLNIVPFIDLMSVCIIFLLITAVWTQVSMIQLGSSIYGKKTTQDQAPPPPKAFVAFRVDVRNTGYNVIIEKQRTLIPKKDGEYDRKGLITELKRVKEMFPEKTDATITVMDELPYYTLIHGMDALMQSGFPEVSIATAGAL